MKQMGVAIAALSLTSACGSMNPSVVPTEGMVAVGSGGAGWEGGSERLSGTLFMDSSCVTIEQEGGDRVVPVFRSGAAQVNDDLTTLRWHQSLPDDRRVYDEGAQISLQGDGVQTFEELDSASGYFIPGGCARFGKFFVVNYWKVD